MPRVVQSSDLPERSSRGKSEMYGGLSLPQVRVLQCLAKAKGPLTRVKITERIGNKTGVVTGRAIGYSDPEKRKAFEQSKDGGFRPSLLSLGYVKEYELKIPEDGINETVVELTKSGKAAFAKLGRLKLPPLRD